jgi:hypothetical protein
VKYGTIRIDALTYWQKVTGRQCHPYGDDINDSYECDWQTRNRKHVSIFCSLGIWASSFSLQLQDERFDDLYLDKTSDSESLYLVYNQILLVVSEILNDLEQLYKQATNKNDGRIFLSDGATISMKDLMGFINNVVKHKAEGKKEVRFHACNHHLPIRFTDNPSSRIGSRTISIGNVSKLTNMKSICMPSIFEIIELLGVAYRSLDRVLSIEANFKRITSAYEKA